MLLYGVLLLLGQAHACPDGMSAIPAGSYESVAARGGVEVALFCLGRTEVTVEAFEECVRSGRCSEPAPRVEVRGMAPRDRQLLSRSCNWGRSGRRKHPMNCLTWVEAEAYCRFRGKRLPTEAEWEWAARGGDEATRYSWGALRPDSRLANVCGAECLQRFQRLGRRWSLMHYGDDGWPTTAPVGSFPQGVGRWDILDLGGNVWELTSTPMPAASEEARVMRGGGWAQTDEKWLRATARAGWWLGDRGSVVGFRCASTGRP